MDGPHTSVMPSWQGTSYQGCNTSCSCESGDHYVHIWHNKSCTGPRRCRPELSFTKLPPHAPPTMPHSDDDDEDTPLPESSSVYGSPLKALAPLAAFVVCTVMAMLLYALPRRFGSRRRVRENSQRMGLRPGGAPNPEQPNDENPSVMQAESSLVCSWISDASSSPDRASEAISSPSKALNNSSLRRASDADTFFNWICCWDSRSYLLPRMLGWLKPTHYSARNSPRMLVVPPPPLPPPTRPPLPFPPPPPSSVITPLQLTPLPSLPWPQTSMHLIVPQVGSAGLQVLQMLILLLESSA